MVVGPDGDYYATDLANSSVQRFDGRTGRHQGEFLSPPAAAALNHPTGLLFAGNYLLKVASPVTNQVLRYDANSGAFAGALVSGSKA